MKEGSQGRRPTGGAGPAAARLAEVPAAVDEEAVVAALAAPPMGEGPRLPDSCKLLLKELAEEMLVMHSRQDTAEQRAELAERKLARRGHAADAAVEEARRQAAEAEDHAATLQRQLTEAQQQLEQEQRLRQAAEERAAELERQLAAAQPQGRRQRQERQEQQEQQADEGMRQLGREMLAGARGGAAAQQRQQQQQQQQRVEAVDRPLPPEQPAAVPAAHAGAARAAAAPGGQSSIEIALHSSDDDETLPGPAGAAGTAAAAAAEAHPAGAKSGEEEAAAAAPPAAMRPPPQRLGSLRGAVNPARQNASRKRPAEASLAAAAAAAGRAQAAQRDEEPSPAKQRRREAPAVDERRRESGRGGLQRLDSASPGESALDALDALGRRMRRSSSAAAAAAAGGSSALSPSSREGGPDLLLRLADAGQAGWEGEEEEEEEEGPLRRNGRRTVGAVAGVVTLKPGETAGQWLNRSIVAYVGTLARERDFRPFEKPVPRSTPDYYALVKKPMDMATVKIKAQRGQYSSPKEFKSDMMLIVDNAKFYNENEKHPVHKAADLLHDYLRKPHSFFSKVDAEFKQAETAAVLNEERAAQEAELELEEERLARSVKKGMIVAVYGADDINGNKYYLLQATGPMLRLRADDTDDFGVTYGKGDTVIEGHYYDYWNRADGEWDRSGGRRPYFLLENMRGLVPASSLLLVDVKLRERPETELSPFVGEQTIYEVSPELHKQLKKAIKKFTAEPAA